MAQSNYHMHTRFCDGREEPLRYVEEALKQGVKSIGFSAHAPMPFYCKWALPLDDLHAYFDTIINLKHVYAREIEIYCGLELDYIPQEWEFTQKIRSAANWDYIIGSIHFIDSFPDGTYWTIDGGNDEFREGLYQIFQNNHEEVVRKYFEYTRLMVTHMKPNIVGHIDKLKMQYGPDCLIPPDHPVFRSEISKTLDVIAAVGTCVELNTRGVYRRGESDFYPGNWVIEEMFKRDIPVTINSDAHRPEEVTQLWQEASETLLKVGYRYIKTLQKGNWVNMPLS